MLHPPCSKIPSDLLVSTVTSSQIQGKMYIYVGEARDVNLDALSKSSPSWWVFVVSVCCKDTFQADHHAWVEDGSRQEAVP